MSQSGERILSSHITINVSNYLHHFLSFKLNKYASMIIFASIFNVKLIVCLACCFMSTEISLHHLGIVSYLNTLLMGKLPGGSLPVLSAYSCCPEFNVNSSNFNQIMTQFDLHVHMCFGQWMHIFHNSQS